MTPPKPDNEDARLVALHGLDILDTPPEEAFDDLTRLAAHLCGVPIAAVSLIDSERQWFKSILGLAARETPRDDAFCAHTILQPGLTVVPDAANDARFADNPLVTGDPNIRFYAGAPLVTEDGHVLGSLCVIDRVPRRLSPEQEAALRMLGRQAASQLALRRSLAEQGRLSAERASALQTVAEGHSLFVAALGAMGEGLMVQDRAGDVLISNRRADEILGPAAKRVGGQGTTRADWRYTHPDGADFPRADRPSRVALRTGEAQRNVVMGIERPGEAILWLSINAVPLFHADAEEAYAAVVTLDDITERRRIEEELRESQRFAESVAENSASIIFVFDLDSRANVYSNRNVAEFLGYDAQQVRDLGADLLPHMIHPDDLPRLRAHFDTFKATADGQVVEFEYRARHVSGEWRWIWNREVIFKRRPDGTPAQILGTAQDVTERRRSEEALRRSEARLAEAQRTAGIGSWDFDVATGRIKWSDEMFRLLDFDPSGGEPDFDTLLTHYHPDDVPMHRRTVAQALEDGLPYEFDIRVLCGGEDGFRWAHAIGHAERDDMGKVLRLSGTVLDIDARKRAEQSLQDHAVVMEFQKNELAEANARLEETNARLEALATEDGLTGLKNHRAFQERLSEEVIRATRYGTALSVILLDVDHFKRYNDRWGHPAGDGVLKTVARLLRENARGTDLVARYGGEEFVLILPQTALKGALVIAERVRRALEAARWDRQAVTASLGVAALSLGMDDGGDLITCADRALYRAKEQGRNRVVASRPEVWDLAAP